MHMLTSEEELKDAIQNTEDSLCIIFKHSTRCPISAAAHRQVAAFEKHSDIPVYLIRVIEERPLSRSFANQYDVVHASPQAIVLRQGKVVWNASHYQITDTALTKATEA